MPDNQPTESTRHISALRTELAKHNLDGFLVPMADEYQSEYVPPSAQRIAFLSGFTGSAAFIVVLKDRAIFFTDGRSTLQANQQLDAALFTVIDSGEKTPSQWLAENAGDLTIGYDPWLHTEDGIERLKKALTKTSTTLLPVEKNPVDAIWHARPAPPTAKIFAHELAYAGKNSADKRKTIVEELKKEKCAAVVIADPTSVAWLLNVRGGDVPNTPLPLSFAILYDTGAVKWFVDPEKITGGLAKVLGDDISIEHPEQFPHALDRLASDAKTVRVDPAITARWIFERLRVAGATIIPADDPCALPRACKNPIELEGMRSAHRRDGAALVKFFAWLEKAVAEGTVTELRAEEKLAEFRAANNLYRGPSFDTIAGSGAHGAIVHYRATVATNRKLENGTLFLLDSGGQYLDGTTDVTRTVAIGNPSQEMRDRFTRVLKGHIALASIRFPVGTTGGELDVLARQYLWSIGLDYSHGTGHGVGSYLGVHEGPQGISRRSKVPLQPGMVLSNEPGYYKNGHYGIRIENLQAVTEAVEIGGGEKKMLGFETLTLAPIDAKLIDLKLMNDDEIAWLNAYHARIREALRPMVDETTVPWLLRVTEKL
jgi:Xaa-Pro aminopeptidase